MLVSPAKKGVALATTGRGLDSAERTCPPSEPQSIPHPEKAVTVLAISPFEDDHVFLRNLFSHSKWHVRGVRTWGEALDYLSRHPMAVVICESQLPDATWKRALDDLSRQPDAPLLIVTSRLADDYLWAEVLNLGGYDVLMKPFDATEVVRVVSLAWLNWKNNWERARSSLSAPKLAAAAG